MTAMSKLAALEGLPRTPASDVKKLGWRGVMDAVRRDGKVVVTNHNRPEAVILPIAEYDKLMRHANDAAAEDEAALEELRREWDERLSVLNAPGARAKFDRLFDEPLDLHGEVLAGQGY